jgi:co-chaperonin GroES (HSP10)
MKSFDGDANPVGNRVFVKEMHFGEQKTKSGLIIMDDDGKTRGIYPRWSQVHAKGPENNDPYNVGDWILVEHGRWTHAFKVNDIELRMAEAEAVIGWADERPNSVQIGAEYGDGEHATIDPSSFINQ